MQPGPEVGIITTPIPETGFKLFFTVDEFGNFESWGVFVPNEPVAQIMETGEFLASVGYMRVIKELSY